MQNCLAPHPSFNDRSAPCQPLTIVSTPGSQPLPAPTLRTPVSAYKRAIRYTALEFPVLLDSSSIDAQGWDQIALSIQSNYKFFDGFVILHGTDSLAYTSSALSFMLQDLGKPVIFTGSQTPMSQLQNDANDNLLSSLVIAGHFMIGEVCLFFNNSLFRGNRATKVSADDFAAFASPNLAPLGIVSSTKTNIAWDLVSRPTTLKPFTVQFGLNTSHVACLRVFPGIKPAMLDAVLKLDGLKGLILETFGAGNAPEGPGAVLTKILADAVNRGVVIVNVTQCLSGTVSALYAPATALGNAGVVFGGDMTTEAALTKLSYLLAMKGISQAEVAQKMAVSLRGELSEETGVTFTHPERRSTGKQSMSILSDEPSFTILREIIVKGDLSEVKDVMRWDQRRLLDIRDTEGNTVLVTISSFILISCLVDKFAASCSCWTECGDTPRVSLTRCFGTYKEPCREHSVIHSSSKRLRSTCRDHATGRCTFTCRRVLCCSGRKPPFK